MATKVFTYVSTSASEKFISHKGIKDIYYYDVGGYPEGLNYSGTDTISNFEVGLDQLVLVSRYSSDIAHLSSDSPYPIFGTNTILLAEYDGIGYVDDFEIGSINHVKAKPLSVNIVNFAAVEQQFERLQIENVNISNNARLASADAETAPVITTEIALGFALTFVAGVTFGSFVLPAAALAIAGGYYIGDGLKKLREKIFEEAVEEKLDHQEIGPVSVKLSIITGGSDRIISYAGNDILNGMAGADKMYGQGGDDTYMVDQAGDKVFEAVGNGNDKVIASSSFTLAKGQEVETLQLSEAATIASKTASAAAPVNFNLTGNEFDQLLKGNGGNNILDGRAGVDTTVGGRGDDIHRVDNAKDVVKEALGQGKDAVETIVSYKLAAKQEIETLKVSSASSTDKINLTGNEFANSLIGNHGANKLDGGLSSDQLTGKGGADTFVFKTLAESTLASTGRDTIMDFSHAQGDRIDLHLIDAVAGGSVNQAFKFIGTADFHHKAGELHATILGSNTLVSGDVNGDGAADFSILLKGALSLQAGDFIL